MIILWKRLGYKKGKSLFHLLVLLTVNQSKRLMFVVDTLGLVLAVVVHSATPHDSKAVENAFKALKKNI
jgi:Ni/Fe-hydrogenase subunit HybB-like protein